MNTALQVRGAAQSGFPASPREIINNDAFGENTSLAFGV